MMWAVKNGMRRLLPSFSLSAYHFLLSLLSAAWYRFPSRTLTVIGVTGTKGKSTTAELIYRMLEEGGTRPALLSTIRFATPHGSRPNLFKMTMPGRFFVQRFLREAARAGATHAVIEMTSEGVKQWRHKWIALDALVFTNLAPEHIESHGSFENYARAKLALARLLEQSPKARRVVVANADDPYGQRFLETRVEVRAPFSLSDAEPYTTDASGTRFMWRGELFSLSLPGVFNLSNALAALTLCEALGIRLSLLQKGLAVVRFVQGRAERVDLGQPFTVVVDYAHTPESLRALYDTFPSRRICVLGNTGGGRDRWKRKVMGSIADESCAISFLTNEDPYDENPEAILAEMREGFASTTPRVVLDRREAIRAALAEAREGDAVLITGKGTDPYIMGPRGTKTPWSDRAVAAEELTKLLEERRGNLYH